MKAASTAPLQRPPSNHLTHHQLCFRFSAVHGECYAETAMDTCPVILSVAASIVLSTFYSFISQTLAQQSPSVEVIKFSWSKERLNWERDPFGGPLENFDEMRARVRNEKRIDDAKRGGGNGADHIKREAKADEANVEQKREKGPPRYVFVYRAKIKNNGSVPIASIDWDYVFTDGTTGEELGRHEFTSDTNVGPGKTKDLMLTLSRPPTQRISVYSLDKNERNGLAEHVVIVAVRYADGTQSVVR
jgi:hypothetical protein